MRLIDADALMADLEKWMKQIDPTHPPEDNAIPPMEDIIVSTLMTIEEQPTIEPQLDEWCDDCAEYDKTTHSCPRWNHVIRETLDDVKREAYKHGRAMAQRWRLVAEQPPKEEEEVFVYLFDPPSPYIAWVKDGKWQTEDFTLDEEDNPIAYMPLPPRYEEEQE